MRQCGACHRRGWLLRLDRGGLCEACAQHMTQQVEQRVAWIRSILAAVEALGDVDWVVEELCLAEAHCRELERLERVAYGCPSTRTQRLLRTVTERRDQALTDWADTVTQAALRQVERCSSAQGREALLTQALQRLQRYQASITEAAGFRESLRQLSLRLASLHADTEAAPESTQAIHRGATASVFAAASPLERRCFPRWQRQFQVTLASGEGPCVAKDLSATGMLLQGPLRQQVGDFLSLQLHMPKGSYHTTGTVVWTGAQKIAGPQSNHTGVAFTGGGATAAG